VVSYCLLERNDDVTMNNHENSVAYFVVFGCIWSEVSNVFIEDGRSSYWLCKTQTLYSFPDYGIMGDFCIQPYLRGSRACKYGCMGGFSPCDLSRLSRFLCCISPDIVSLHCVFTRFCSLCQSRACSSLTSASTRCGWVFWRTRVNAFHRARSILVVGLEYYTSW
jgi:hypothetical protein